MINISKKQGVIALSVLLSAIVVLGKGYAVDTYDKYVALWLILAGLLAFACVILSSRKIFSPMFEKIAMVASVSIPFLTANVDMDTFWIVSVGRNILKHGFDGIDRINFYHFHSIAQQWLTAVTLAEIDRYLGRCGLIFFTGVIGLLFAYVTYQAARETKIPWTVTLCVMVVYMHFLSTRPFMISALLLAVEYLLFRRGKYWMIPVTGILFINIHMALWPMQILLLGTLLVEAFFEKRLTLEQIICVALVVPAALLNPYGQEGFLYPFSIMSKNLSYLTEMASPLRYFTVCSTTFIMELLFVGQIVVSSVWHKKRMRIGPLIALAGTMGMTATAGRHVVLTCIPLPYILAEFASGEKAEGKEKVGMVMSATVIACLLVASYTDVINKEQIRYQKAIDVLDGQPSGVLYTGMNAGGYASYRGYHPYMDGRTEPHYLAYNHEFDWWDEYLRSMGDAKPLVEKYRFDYALCDRDVDGAMITEMKKRHAKVLYSDSSCVLYKCTYSKKDGKSVAKRGVPAIRG